MALGIRHKSFQTKQYTAAAQYDLEFGGGAIDAVSLRFASTLTSASIANVRDDAAFRVLGTPEINQAESPIVRMRGASWRHLAALTMGGYEYHTAGTTQSVNGQVVAQATLDFAKMMPRALINAGDKKVFVRGEFGALAVYSGTAPTAITGTLRPLARMSEADTSGGFLRPRITETAMQLGAADDMQQQIKFDQDVVVLGIMATGYQSSTAASPRSDGVVKNIRMDVVNTDNGNFEAHRGTWGQFRTATCYSAKFNADDYARSTGVIWLPLITRKNPQYNGAMLFKGGDSITIHTDCLPTIEEEYTAVTTATGDTLVLTVVGFTPVDQNGTGVSAVRDALSVNSQESRKAQRGARLAY